MREHKQMSVNISMVVICKKNVCVCVWGGGTIGL